MGKSIFEKMGLARAKEVDPEMMFPSDISGGMDFESGIQDSPEIDVNHISYDDLIQSIYAEGGIGQNDSIFQIRSYMDVLPGEMTTAKKQATIAGIFTVNRIDVNALIKNGEERTGVLMAALESIRKTNGDTIAQEEQRIEELKGMIEQAEAAIAEAKRRTAESDAIINAEAGAIQELIAFASGIASSDQKEG